MAMLHTCNFEIVEELVLPVEDLHDPGAMRRFVDGVRSVDPDATGMAVSLLETADVVVKSLREALAAAAVVILLLLLFLWRSPTDALAGWL